MSQQHPNSGEPYDYAAPPNRSPNSSRAAYPGAGAFPSGFSLPRHAQRHFDQPLGSAALYGGDRVGPGYNMRGGMDQMGPTPGLPATYMLDNSQSWAYNSAGVATVNGPLNGASRQRSSNRRTALPQTWTDPSLMGMQQSMGGFQPQGVANMQGLRMDQGHDGRGASHGTDSDQLIPTAIVIKNIPFAVRKEQLAQLMTDLNLPQPYAFNYHFDGGIFRGLAFANFSSPEETRIVIESMNGLDVQGRKLRVEYKKMLPEAERERIEREKRERRGQLEEQHRGPMLHQQPSLSAMSNMASSQQQRSAHLRDVDLNNPTTLQYYTELTLFRRDESREIMIFPTTVSPEDRRQIHILAHYMGLEHRSVGDNDSRQIQVLKTEAVPSPTAHSTHAPTSVGLDLHKRGLSRAATFDFAADRDSRMTVNSYSHSNLRQGPTLELPGSPDGSGIPNNLRTAKSFADLRSFSPSPSHSSSSYLNPGAGMGGMSSAAMASRLNDYTGTGSSNDASVLAGTLSGLNLGSFESAATSAQNRSTPGAIGSHRPGANGTSNRAAPERQPRGPEWETSAGFTRGRPNGHMQRGSDSSDNGGRPGTGSRYH